MVLFLVSYTIIFDMQEPWETQGLVAHACNHSYLGGEIEMLAV
jgi:hypothetical protein